METPIINIELLDRPFKCDHCGKGFMKERTMINHMCENKRRFFQKNEKRVQTGFYVFKRFFELTQKNFKERTYDDFCKSGYYNAFVKFGSFINNVKPIYPEKFIDYVIKSGIKLDHWAKDSVYEKYLQETIKTEPVDSALERSLNTMIKWGESNNAEFSHYFKYVGANRAVHDIKDGKISPWLLLNCKSGKKLLESFNDDQLTLISTVFDIVFWSRKFKQEPKEVELVRTICKEAKIH
jgi:hypothetical protein